jgi:DNA replication protein DnaD
MHTLLKTKQNPNSQIKEGQINLSTWGAETGTLCEFEDSLIYRVSSGSARTAQRNSVSIKQTKTNKTKQKTKKKRKKEKTDESWAVVAHTFNPSTWEAEAGGFLSSRPAWSTE